MKGIILAGGEGTRLAPLTAVVSKQLLPVYDKPMICYPLATLMNLGITDILIISTPKDTPNIKDFLGNGADYGLKIQYKTQKKANGIADAFLIGEKFIGKDNVCLILGDNIFYGSEISGELLQKNIDKIGKEIGGYIFSYHVSDPERYGVIEFDEGEENIINIEEKPKHPKSNWAVTGLYFYDNSVVKITKSLKPSLRGELEITDVNNAYLSKGLLNASMVKGFWSDAGTISSLYSASVFARRKSASAKD